jgi:hypothetical protein
MICSILVSLSVLGVTAKIVRREVRVVVWVRGDRPLDATDPEVRFHLIHPGGLPGERT